MKIGVIMGDIVNSRQHPKMFFIPSILNDIVEKLKFRFKIAIQIYKGDEFTITVENPAQTITVLLEFKRLLIEHELQALMVSSFGVIDYYNKEVPGYCYGPIFPVLSDYLNYLKSLNLHLKSSFFLVPNKDKKRMQVINVEQSKDYWENMAIMDDFMTTIMNRE